MQLLDMPVTSITGEDTTLASLGGDGLKAVLVVNVASKCGFTKQYAGLEALNKRFASQGLLVVGFPCNQFLAQEPGSASDIQEYCQLNFGVTFPLMQKIKVNGRSKHPLFARLHEVPDAAGKGGRVAWNFEKFLITPSGSVSRFRSKVEPESDELLAAIEAALAA